MIPRPETKCSRSRSSRRAQLDTEERVDGAEDGRKKERQYEGDRNSERIRKYDECDGRQTVDRSHRQIDFADDDDQGLTGATETKDRCILSDVPHREERPPAVEVDRGERYKDDDNSDDGAEVRPAAEAG